MDQTAAVTAFAHREAYEDICDGDHSFWKCTRPQFVGCCDHDPCQDGYCHDPPIETVDHISLPRLYRRAPSTTTVTYTLSRVPGSAIDPSASADNLLIANAVISQAVPTPRLSAASITSPKAQTVVKPNTSPSPLITTSSTTSTPINPTAAPVAGSKKSKAAIAGISIGVIAAAIIALLFTYMIISRQRQSHTRRTKSARRAKHNNYSNTSSKDTIDIIPASNDATTPLTPSGAKLEAQRGAMLHHGRHTGFRGLRMTTTYQEDEETRGRRLDRPTHSEWRHESVPALKIPAPASFKAPSLLTLDQRPASHLAMGRTSLGAAFVHPAYRQSLAAATANPRFYDAELHLHQQREPTESTRPLTPLPLGAVCQNWSDHVGRPVSWAPGADCIDVATVRSEEEEEPNKPRFHDATSKWAEIVGVRNEVEWGAGREEVALCTENQITSPVEGGRPRRRGTVKGVV